MAKHVTRGLTSALGIGLVACACGAPSDDPGAGSRAVGVTAVSDTPLGEVVPEPVLAEGRTVRAFDLVATQPNAKALLAALEIPIVQTRRDPSGRPVFRIHSTGFEIARLREAGFEAHMIPTNPLAPMADNPCNWTSVASVFPPYDTKPSLRGLADQLRDIAAIGDSRITTHSLGKSAQGRDIMAIRFGPPVPVSAPSATAVPTVYVVAAHHAREWVTPETTMRLAKWLASSLATNAEPVKTLLASAAIVLVPVVNPDGYQYTHETDRTWRKTRQTNNCSTGQIGTDPNRNYVTTWDTAADNVSSDPCTDTYRGPFAGSAPETNAIMKLLTKDHTARELKLVKPVAALSYHSYSSVVLFSPGFDGTATQATTRCDPAFNCINPDMTHHRELFGGWALPFMKDESVAPSVPYPTDTQQNVMYTNVGDFLGFTNFGSAGKMFAATAELTGTNSNFYLECDANYEAVLSSVVNQQKSVVQTMLMRAPGYAGSTTATNYAVQNWGEITGAWLAREKVKNRTDDSARPRLILGVHNLYTPPATIDFAINGSSSIATFQRERRGAQYTVFAFENPAPSKVPCQVTGKGLKDKGSGGFDCEGYVDLCDPKRFDVTPAGSWTLEEKGLTERTRDCWWEPTATAGTIAIPSFTPPATTKQCWLSLSAYTQPDSGNDPIVVEGQIAGQWRQVTRWPYEAPIGEWRDSVNPQIRTSVFEAGGRNGVATIPFRVRAANGYTSSTPFRLYDLLVGCVW